MDASACRVVLVGPENPRNVGFAARAMLAFGASELVLVAAPWSSIPPEARRTGVAARNRVTLNPGETRTVDIPLKAATLAYYDEKQASLKVEPEPISLMIGDSSKDIKLTGTVRIR